MSSTGRYDVAIVGGGLAGLSCAILLARQHHRVALFEKESYPFHKVCGEYISLESYDFLLSLGLKLEDMHLPVIHNLVLSSVKGTLLEHRLPLGGFGISRFTIDQELALIAKSNGVELFEKCKVTDVIFENDAFTIASDRGTYTSGAVCAAFGKRSNLDVKWNRKFTLQKPNALNNYIAVKYHASIDHTRDTIALHNFSNGYCGISPVENDTTCICYLTTAQNLKTSGNSIPQLEEQVLCKNPYLKKAFTTARILYEKPLAISQISFDRKRRVEGHMLFLGDAAGLIAPLCGNGMSMALHSSRVAADIIQRFLANQISRTEMERMYEREWKKTFGNRLLAGRMIQSVFGREWVTETTIQAIKKFPSLVTRIIRQTHG